MNHLNPANEPIGASTIAVIITWVGSHYALNLDATTASAVALVVFAVAQWVARRFSTPVKKAQETIDQAYLTQPGDPKPTL